MDKVIIKISKALSVVLMIVATVFTVIVLSYGSSATAPTTEPGYQMNLDFGFYTSYIAIFIGLAVSLIFPIYFMIQHPKMAKRGLMGVGILAFVLFISWAMASSDNVGEVYEKFNVSTSMSKLIGGGLISTYLLGIIAVLTIVYSAVSKLFKK